MAKKYGRTVVIRSFAKINLSLDVGNVQEDGYHPVDMIMQLLLFHDDVEVSYRLDKNARDGSHGIKMKTNRPYLPTDERNIAWKAADLMSRRYGASIPGGVISVDITKRIPVAAGMAGGSGNAAAVLHALNILWDLKLTLKELMDLGAELGSDVPFCVMGQAKANRNMPEYLKKDPMASCTARATGTGTTLEPLASLARPVVFAKPRLSVSTKEVYQNIDNIEIESRPNNDILGNCLEINTNVMYYECINVLENYTLVRYKKARDLKETMKALGGELTLMSGSGPTIFSIYKTMEEAEAACQRIRDKGYEAYWTKTIV